MNTLSPCSVLKRRTMIRRGHRTDRLLWHLRKRHDGWFIFWIVLNIPPHPDRQLYWMDFSVGRLPQMTPPSQTPMEEIWLFSSHKISVRGLPALRRLYWMDFSDGELDSTQYDTRIIDSAKSHNLRTSQLGCILFFMPMSTLCRLDKRIHAVVRFYRRLSGGGDVSPGGRQTRMVFETILVSNSTIMCT